MPARNDPAGAFREQLTRGCRLLVDPEFEDAVRALDLPDPAVRERLFSGSRAAVGRSGTAIVALPGRSERLHLRPVLHGGALARAWGPRLLGLGRPISELRVSAALRAQGAPVPRPVLVFGWRASPLWSAVLATLHIEGACDGVAWLADTREADAITAGASAAGHAIRHFHDVGGRHADLHVKNLLLRATEDGVEAFVIDLDKARAGPGPTPKRRMLELARLYRSLRKRGLLEQIGERGQAAFLAAYLDGDAALGRALLSHWPAERRRVSRHILGYGASR